MSKSVWSLERIFYPSARDTTTFLGPRGLYLPWRILGPLISPKSLSCPAGFKRRHFRVMRLSLLCVSKWWWICEVFVLLNRHKGPIALPIRRNPGANIAKCREFIEYEVSRGFHTPDPLPANSLAFWVSLLEYQAFSTPLFLSIIWICGMHESRRMQIFLSRNIFFYVRASRSKKR